MKRTPVLAAIAALNLLATPAFAGQPGNAPARVEEAAIAFANHGGVDDWRAEGDSTIYFKDSHRRWYRATLFMPAFDLSSVEHIGIDAGPTGSLDKWSSIYVRGQRYSFQSFERIEGPPPRRHRHSS